ncbi:hypothetical protein Q5752_007071 [Cryptotrichosporon argae]
MIGGVELDRGTRSGKSSEDVQLLSPNNAAITPDMRKPRRSTGGRGAPKPNYGQGGSKQKPKYDDGLEGRVAAETDNAKRRMLTKEQSMRGRRPSSPETSPVKQFSASGAGSSKAGRGSTSKSSHIPSSNLPLPAVVSHCYVEGVGNEASVNNITVAHGSTLRLWRGVQHFCEISLRHVAKVTVHLTAERPLIHIDLRLDRHIMHDMEEKLLLHLPDLLSNREMILELEPGDGSAKAVQLLHTQWKPNKDVTVVDLSGALALIASGKGYVEEAQRRYQRQDDERARRAAAADRRRSSHLPKPDKGKGKGKADDDPAQTRLKLSDFPRQADTERRRSKRLSSTQHNRDNPVTLGESDDDDAPQVAQPSRPAPPSRLDKGELLFQYPFSERSAVEIRKGEKYRLEDHEFLNDVLLEFGLKLVTKEQVPLPDVYQFNSFFYVQLSRRDRENKLQGDKWPAYESVKKWNKGHDMFDQRFIIVPINEQLHWYLAVIVNPAGILRSKDAPNGAGLEAASDSDSPQPPAAFIDEDQSQAPPVQVDDDEDVQQLGSDEGMPFDGNTSIDELDFLSHATADDSFMAVTRAQEPNGVGNIQSGVDAMSLESGGPVEVKKDKSDKSAKLSRPTHDILGSGDTYILTFDSLGGAHKPVYTVLNRWLHFEARAKKGVTHELRDAIYLEAKVPQQTNFCDCGLFLVHYAKCLLADAERVLEFVGRPAPYTSDQPAHNEWQEERNKVWRASDTNNLRREWLEEVDLKTAAYRSSKEDQARHVGTAGSHDAETADSGSIGAVPARPPSEGAMEDAEVNEMLADNDVDTIDEAGDIDVKDPSRPSSPLTEVTADDAVETSHVLADDARPYAGGLPIGKAKKPLRSPEANANIPLPPLDSFAGGPPSSPMLPAADAPASGMKVDRATSRPPSIPPFSPDHVLRVGGRWADPYDEDDDDEPQDPTEERAPAKGKHAPARGGRGKKVEPSLAPAPAAGTSEHDPIAVDDSDEEK